MPATSFRPVARFEWPPPAPAPKPAPRPRPKILPMPSADVVRSPALPADGKKRPPRPKLFGTENPCELVRSILIATLDRAYCDGALGAALHRDSDSDRLREWGRDVFQEIQLCLFPEEFAEDPQAAARIAAAGLAPAALRLRGGTSLVPPGGPRRAGLPRLAAFAAAIRAAAR